MRKTGCQLNNKGLTFVEILVAVTMLTLVSLVFLRCISQTAFYNQRAREKQSALNLAQSLMEGFKAYDLGSIDAQFGSSIQSDFKMYNLEDSAAQSMSGTGSYGLSRVKINGVEYDARISMTEYTPAVSSVVAKTGLVESDIPNKYTDAIYCGDEISKEQKGIYQMVVDELKDATKVPDMKAADRTALTVDTLKIMHQEILMWLLMPARLKYLLIMIISLPTNMKRKPAVRKHILVQLALITICLMLPILL